MGLFRKKTEQFQIDKVKRNALKKKYEALIRRFGMEPEKKTGVDFYYELDVEKKSILVLGLGTNVRGSMQYVLDILNHSKEFEGYTIYVRTRKNHTDETVKEFIRQNNWTRTKTVPAGYTRKQETCQYLITESYFPYSWIRRPEQVMVDIWHGTPLKKIGIVKNGRKRHCQAVQQKNFLSADYLLYPNDYTRDIMWDSFGITSLQSAKALMLGYPRTAGLINVSEERKKELSGILAPHGEHIYAYMPTFRGYLSDEDTVSREVEFLKELDQKLRHDQILYVNLHHHVGAALDDSQFEHIRKFPPLIDSYELLTVTEALISDYSSVFFDYLILRKQIILHIDDYNIYSGYQGLNLDIRNLPFDKAQTADEVIEMLNRGKQYDDTEIFESLCKYDGHDNAEKLCQLFTGNTQGLTLEDIPGTSAEKVLLYTENCSCAAATDLLDQLVQTEQQRYEIYVGCEEDKVRKNKKKAYPMMFHANVIASKNEEGISSVGIPVLQSYLNGKISFRKAMEFLKHEYALVPIRMYGNAKFDTIAVYDTTNPEMILALALSSAKNRLLFVNQQMAAKMKEGDQFLKDAIIYAAEYCKQIIVASDEDGNYLKSILQKKDIDKIVRCETTDEIIKMLDTMQRD